MVRKLKGAFGLRKLGLKIGHCGTLDPMATGVLPISIGSATRFSRYVLDGDKSYRATITFGVETDSYDADGTVTSTADASGIECADVESALGRYVGEFDQVPPLFSAIQVEGRRMYSVARAGGDAVLPSRRVCVDSVRVIEWDLPNLKVEISCGKGFYVRSFAHDLGRDLGCGAHLSQLRRMTSGVFVAQDAVALESLVSRSAGGAWTGGLLPTDAVLQHLPSIRLDAAGARAFSHGMAVQWDGLGDIAEARVYGEGGALLGVGSGNRTEGSIAPTLVIA